MSRSFVRNKVARAYEAADLTLRLTRDLGSRVALLSAYAGIVLDPNDMEEVSLELTVRGTKFPIRMRKSDVFTLSEIFFRREYAIVSRIPSSPIVFDCGANIGLSVIWFLATLPGARVYAFEPEPSNFRLLFSNLSSRSDVTLEAAAVGKSSGTTQLHVAEHGALHSVRDRSYGVRTIDVPLVNLSDYMRQKKIDRIDLLKLDVEGSELDALEGLGSLIDDVGVIAGELHPNVVRPDDFHDFVKKRGFRVVRKVIGSETHLFELAR